MFIPSLIALAVPILLFIVTPKQDQRFRGFRIGVLGIFLCFSAPLFFELASVSADIVLCKTFNIVGYSLFVAGYLIVIAGSIIHVKLMAKPVDAKRDVDPGYDLPQVECPFCNKAFMRIDVLPCKCPICKKWITKTMASNKTPS